jgi:hypothetical protein
MILAIRRTAVLSLLALALAVAPASAQLEDALEDINEDVAVGYLGPFSKGLSASLNSGIFRSGDVPLMGLNFTVDFKAVVVGFADDDRTFIPSTLPEGFTTEGIPTVIGDTGAGSAIGPGGAEIAYPGGFDLEHFGVLVPQVTVGSVAGTRAIFRYISLELGDEDLGDFSLFGIGGQHSISRYLPGLPVDVAAGVMYQSFEIGDDLVKAKALAFNVTGSKKFGRVVNVEPYLGLGIDTFKMEAKYDFDDDSVPEGFRRIEADFDRETDLHLTLGAGVNLPVVKLHGELNVAAENGWAAGVSFGN